MKVKFNMRVLNKLLKIPQTLNSICYLYIGIRVLGKFSLRKYLKLKSDLSKLNKQSIKSSYCFPIAKLYPCYEDIEDNAGTLLFHYFFQDLYVAQQILKNNPQRHVDIGSRIDGFVAHIATFREIVIYDIRPLEVQIPNVVFVQKDLMNDIGCDAESLDSISCLHALEHFGLGRYGDPICFDGFYIGFMNIVKLLKIGGKLYFSVPMGKQRIEFHAHRVFSLSFLVDMISNYFHIDIFSYVDDRNILHCNAKLSAKYLADNFGCNFGCAIFELTKK